MAGRDLVHTLNKKVTIPAGGKITVTFLDAAGKKTEAKAMDFRLKAAMGSGHAGEVHFHYTAKHDDAFVTGAPAAGEFTTDNTRFFLYDGASFRTEDGEVIGKMIFYNSDAVVDIDLHMFARSDVDISGSTMA